MDGWISGVGNRVPGTPVSTQLVFPALDLNLLWFLDLLRETSTSRREGMLDLTSNSGFGWVGGVRWVVGGWGLPQHMACNCGLVDSEKGGPVMVFR